MVNTIRSGLVFVVLGAVCYGAYVSLSTGPEPQPPAEAGDDWGAPSVELTSLPDDSPPPTVLEGQPKRIEGEPTLALPPRGDLGAAQPWGTPGPSPHAVPQEEPLRAPPPQSPAPIDGDQVAQSAPFHPEAPKAEPYLPPQGDGNPTDVSPAAPPAADADFKQIQDDMARVQEHLNAERLAQALRELTPYLNHAQLSPQQQSEINALLDQLAGTVIYDRNDHSVEPPYEVQPGEQLDVIAERYHVPWQLLANINGITDPHSLQTGEKLKVVRGPFHAEVDLTHQCLVLTVDDMYAGRFNIATEPDENLKPGEFAVRMRKETPSLDPYSTSGPSENVGEPAGKWLELSGGQRIQAGAESPLQSRATRGSILLSGQDANNVHDILSVGSKVRIIR